MAKLLERMVAIPLGAAGEALEGVYLGGPDGSDSGAVVAPPHPLYGGSMDSPVVNEVSYACRKAGLAALRFNWRGVGASAGRPSGEVADADADYAALLGQVPALTAPVQALLADDAAAESPAMIASAVELVLEGLHLSKRLNKDAAGVRAQYRSR